MNKKVSAFSTISTSICILALLLLLTQPILAASCNGALGSHYYRGQEVIIRVINGDVEVLHKGSGTLMERHTYPDTKGWLADHQAPRARIEKGVLVVVYPSLDNVGIRFEEIPTLFLEPQ